MAISLSRMEDLLDSNGRILMQMVLVFYPSVTLPYMVRTILLFNLVIEKVNHQMKCLQSWIVMVLRKIQKALMLYWQSTIKPLLDRSRLYLQWKMRAIWDPIAKKMNNLSEVLKNYLTNDAGMGQPKVKLIGKLALFSARILLQDSELYLKYDKNGVITVHFVIICLCLLTYSERYREKLKILRRRWGCIVNSSSNFTWFILALLFGTYYDNSLKNLGVAFCMTIFSLSLLVVLRPWTDFGLFGFIIGVVGSITYNRFGLKFPTWIVACICYLIFCLKSWIEKHWLDFEEDQQSSRYTNIGSACMIASFPQIWFSVSLSSRRYAHSPPRLFTVIFWCLITAIYSMGFWSHDIKKRAPKVHHLPPYPRSRTDQYVYYRFVICSLALDFLHILGIAVATSVPWRSFTTLLVLTQISISGTDPEVIFDI